MPPREAKGFRELNEDDPAREAPYTGRGLADGEYDEEAGRGALASTRAKRGEPPLYGWLVFVLKAPGGPKRRGPKLRPPPRYPPRKGRGLEYELIAAPS